MLVVGSSGVAKDARRRARARPQGRAPGHGASRQSTIDAFPSKPSWLARRPGTESWSNDEARMPEAVVAEDDVDLAT